MEKLLIQHFKGILMETQSNREEEIEKISQYTPKKVNREQNMALLRVITEKEVEVTVKKMARTKPQARMDLQQSSSKKHGAL